MGKDRSASLLIYGQYPPGAAGTDSHQCSRLVQAMCSVRNVFRT